MELRAGSDGILPIIPKNLVSQMSEDKGMMTKGPTVYLVKPQVLQRLNRLERIKNREK